MSPARSAVPHGPLVRVAGFRLHVLDTERTTRRAQWTPKQQPTVPVSPVLLQVEVRRRDCRAVRGYQHTEMRDHKILQKRKAVQATMDMRSASIWRAVAETATETLATWAVVAAPQPARTGW